MKKVLILGAAALITLAACSGGSKAASTTQAPTTQAPATTAPAPATTAAPAAPITTTVAPTTTVPPTTTTVDPVEAARTAYAGITSGFNPVLYAAEAKYESADGSIPAKNAQAFCADVAPASESFAGAIRDGQWPPSAKDQADTLAKDAAAETSLYYQCANAKTAAAAIATLNSVPSAGVDAAASALRLALGMPIDR